MDPVSFFGLIAFVIVSILFVFRYVDGDHLPEYSKLTPAEEHSFDLLVAVCHNQALIVEAKADPLVTSGDVVESITTGREIPVLEIDDSQLVYGL